MYTVKQKINKKVTKIIDQFATIGEAETFITGTNYFIHFSADAIRAQGNPQETFWNGKNPESVSQLNVAIDGRTWCEIRENMCPALDDWRKLQNAYYRYYNDGDGFVNKLRHLANRHGIEITGYHTSRDFRNPILEDKLEQLADVVFAAALREKIAA
jgi:hypothetical protein